MRRLAALTLLASLVLAGCVAPDAAPGAGDGAPGPTAAFAADCSRSPGTDAWPDPCTILASPNKSPSKTEIDLAVNPLDPNNVIVGSKDLDPLASDSCVWSVLQVTKDGGKTWKTVYVGGDKADRAPLLTPWACITDPIMVFDAEGVAYYALQAYDAAPKGFPVPLPVVGEPTKGSTFILARSKDGGETWDHYVEQHVGDGNIMFHDYPRMIVNPVTQSVHTIWNGVGTASVVPWVSSTRDGGETIDPPVTFAFEDAPTGTEFDSGFDVTKDGVIFVNVAKYPVTGEDKGVYIWRSDDDARSFQLVGKAFDVNPTPRQLPEERNRFRTPSFVEMAIDRSDGPHSGRIYTFWPEYVNEQSDILSRWSDDGGLTWSEPVNIATDPANDQLFMRPTVGPDGTVHVLFASRAWDPANKLLDQVHAWSTDGGVTWSNARLTATSFDGDLGIHQDGPPFIGDYNGIKVGPDGTIWAGWGDTRTGVAEIAMARIVPQRG